MGMYLSKKHERKLSSTGSATDPETKRQASECKKVLYEYLNTHGIDHCYYIPREHGNEISLMTEIVDKQHRREDQSLFPLVKGGGSKKDENLADSAAEEETKDNIGNNQDVSITPEDKKDYLA